MEMKLVVQDGSVLSRRTLQILLPLLPISWVAPVDTLVVYSAQNDALSFSYYKKERVLGVHWPSSASSPPDREAAITELAVALVIVATRGNIPNRVGKSVREAALTEIASRLPRLLEVVRDGA
jgi:hypothetical protein